MTVFYKKTWGYDHPIGKGTLRVFKVEIRPLFSGWAAHKYRRDGRKWIDEASIRGVRYDEALTAALHYLAEP